MKCPDVVAVEFDILCYNFSFLCLLKANCNFQRGVLRTFCPALCCTVAEFYFAEAEEKRVLLLIFRCCLYAKSTILCYDLASLPFKIHFVVCRRGLEGFVQHYVYSC